jgi:mRNA-degrading endonuclease toxin of MazEF toxin-antitoxin module
VCARELEPLLVERVGRLSGDRMREVCEALDAALKRHD